MKSFLKKIFGKKEETEDAESIQKKSIDSPEIDDDLELDEKFAQNFTKSGGKFIYCIDESEVLQSLNAIFSENSWDEILSFDESINNLLDRAKIKHSNQAGANCAFFAGCEALIAEDGSIMISSHQTKGRKLPILPYDFIIIANVKDILSDRSEGLRCINMRSKGNNPSGITTIKGPNTVTGTNNILDTGSINTSKNIYLLLTE